VHPSHLTRSRIRHDRVWRETMPASRAITPVQSSRYAVWAAVVRRRYPRWYDRRSPSRLLVRGPSTTPNGGWMQGPAMPRWGGGAHMATVTFDHVTKKYGDVLAVDDLNLAIADGEFMVLVGPSGCG